jgi:hypothetical protein
MKRDQIKRMITLTTGFRCIEISVKELNPYCFIPEINRKTIRLKNLLSNMSTSEHFLGVRFQANTKTVLTLKIEILTTDTLPNKMGRFVAKKIFILLRLAYRLTKYACKLKFVTKM